VRPFTSPPAPAIRVRVWGWRGDRRARDEHVRARRCSRAGRVRPLSFRLVLNLTVPGRMLCTLPLRRLGSRRPRPAAQPWPARASVAA
jgi:hypothetical protein